MLHYVKVMVGWILVLLGWGCQPEAPVLSVITIDGEALRSPVNPSLYGLSLEEVNHALDGGLYAELIQNRSFEDGVPPLNCPYDFASNLLSTPNGWSLPFIRPDSIVGWHPLTTDTHLYIDTQGTINEYNRRSLLVSSVPTDGKSGGVYATGYKGISIRKGETYVLSFFAKGASMVPKEIQVALEDSIRSCRGSENFTIAPSYEWRRYSHVFTATENWNNAVLTFRTDSAAVFWLDVVSLFPEKTWKGRSNGQRADLMELIAALHPQFIRFPGGSFAEGYTAGTFPLWRESLGDIASRKSFWNVHSYGSTNGLGFHEFLQLCEDLEAEPVFVIHSGVTSQSRRPRYEDITAMDKLVDDALNALRYANESADSLWGSWRSRNGHPEPFRLKYVEIGSENYGMEYRKRFELFRAAIKEFDPEITVISSSFTSRKNWGDWVDSHYGASPAFFEAACNRFDSDRIYRRSQGLFIGEFGTWNGEGGTLQAALGEACFLIGVERNPSLVKQLAYAPILRNVNYPTTRPALIEFDHYRSAVTPSYLVWKLFNDYRGDETIKTSVQTYMRPQVTFGRFGFELFDNSFELKNVMIDGVPVTAAETLSGGWRVEKGVLQPDANRWNYLLTGDPLAYNGTFTMEMQRTKGSGQIQIRMRDNGLSGDSCDYVCMTLGAGKSELYRQVGSVKDTLSSSTSFPLENNRVYQIRIECQDESLTCYVDDVLVHAVHLQPLPSLVAGTVIDYLSNRLYLKVVNTTNHEEKTELRVQGLSVGLDAECWQISGAPEDRNTLDTPDVVSNVHQTVRFSLGGPMIYHFPPNSVTLLLLQVE
ncbi:MAG: alpha-L-arabinofuranosidase C-terminal domain-containing protein [Parabacteroides sp.]|nr:alpha-L-arabinofuranosidase C-terminal domain-containing protein [bacterium]MDY4102297.1 alpha-L-arabinofuranosidase C-terminal domain-containing protein [Parabacteroides sp.]